MTNPLSTLTALELAAAAAPVQSVLTNIANGDGSVASVTGQGIALEGELIAILPTLQKIGINNVAAYLNEQITAFVASQTPAATTEPVLPIPEAPVQTVA